MEIKLDRREFMRAAATALVAGVAVQILGCGSNSDNYGSGFGSNPDGSAGPGDREGSIENNHAGGRHVAIVTRAEIDNGQLLILSIQGYAGHNHTISLTTGDLSDISSGKRVSKTSSDTNDHYHTVNF